MIALKTAFRYRHAFGDREPYLDGLRQARALAQPLCGPRQSLVPSAASLLWADRLGRAGGHRHCPRAR